MGYTRPGSSSSRISQNPYRVGRLSKLGYLYFLVSEFTDDVCGRIAATLSYVAERNGEENVAYVRPRPALPEVDGDWREAHAAPRARGHPSNQGDVRGMPQSQAHRWPLRSLGGGRQGLQVGRVEVCGAQVRAPPKQLFHILLVAVGVELGDSCAERGGDRRAGQVEPRGYLMGAPRASST